MKPDHCEWNPEFGFSARSTDPFHADAVWSIGKNPSWHLCATCVDLPRFKRFRKRTWIGGNEATNNHGEKERHTQKSAD